jgi:predicted dehydrogenase
MPARHDTVAFQDTVMPSDRRDFLHQSAAGLAAVFAINPNPRDLARISRLPREVSVAVIGAGPQGRDIMAELAKFPDVRISAVCDTDQRRLQRGLRRTRDAKGYADVKQMLLEDGGTSVAFLATPTHLHKEIALTLLDAKKHVYCEAPLAHTVEDAKALARAAATAPTVFHAGHLARSNPVYKLARSFFKSGSIMDLVSLRTSWRRKSSWRIPTNDATRERELNWRLDEEVSVGLPGEAGSHLFDTLGWFTGKDPVAVRGSGSTLLYRDGRKIPDTVLCQFDFGEGVQMAFDATLANSFESTYELLSGTMGTIKLANTHGWLFKEADAPVQGWEVYANRQQFHDERGITLIADATKLAEQGKLQEGIGLPHPPLYYAIESFLQSVTKGLPPACSAADALRAAAVAIKAHEAVMAGTEIAIPADLLKA